MQTVLTGYEKIINNIPLIIETSGLRDGYIAKKIGIRQSNFSVKKMRNSWKFDEIKKIIEVVTNPAEDVQDLLDNLEADIAMQDERIGFDEHKKEIEKCLSK